MCLVKGPDEIHRLPLLSIPDTKVVLVVVECQQQWTQGKTGSVLTRRPPNVQRAVRQLPRSPDGNHERGHRRYGGPYGNEHPGDRAEAMREGLKDGRITRSRPPFSRTCGRKVRSRIRRSGRALVYLTTCTRVTIRTLGFFPKSALQRSRPGVASQSLHLKGADPGTLPRLCTPNVETLGSFPISAGEKS